LDCGNFYASAGIGYFPRLPSISMEKFHTTEVRAGIQVNNTGLKNTFFVPFTFDLSVEIRVITETYFYTTGGYTANVGIECLAKFFLIRNLYSCARFGIMAGIVFPIFSITCYEENFSLFPFIPYNMMIIPEIGWVISF